MNYGARHQVCLTPHSRPAKNAQSHENTNKTTTHRLAESRLSYGDDDGWNRFEIFSFWAGEATAFGF